MARNKTRNVAPTPEGDILHLIVDKAIETGKIQSISPLILAWYRHNIDARGFVADGDIGPAAPETSP